MKQQHGFHRHTTLADFSSAHIATLARRRHAVAPLLPCSRRRPQSNRRRVHQCSSSRRGQLSSTTSATPVQPVETSHTPGWKALPHTAAPLAWASVLQRSRRPFSAPPALDSRRCRKRHAPHPAWAEAVPMPRYLQSRWPLTMTKHLLRAGI